MELAPWTGRGWKKYLLVVGLFSSLLITFRLTSSVLTSSGALSAVDPVTRHGRNYRESLLVHENGTMGNYLHEISITKVSPIFSVELQRVPKDIILPFII
jgi:hypothetical protein